MGMSTSGSMSARVRRVMRQQSCKHDQSDNEHSFSGIQSMALQAWRRVSSGVSNYAEMGCEVHTCKDTLADCLAFLTLALYSISAVKSTTNNRHSSLARS